MWRSWWFGLGTFAAGVSWVYVSIHFYSHTPAPLAILMTLFFVAGLAWFFALMGLSYQRFLLTKLFLIYPSQPYGCYLNGSVVGS